MQDSTVITSDLKREFRVLGDREKMGERGEEVHWVFAEFTLVTRYSKSFSRGLSLNLFFCSTGIEHEQPCIQKENKRRIEYINIWTARCRQKKRKPFHCATIIINKDRVLHLLEV